MFCHELRSGGTATRLQRIVLQVGKCRIKHLIYCKNGTITANLLCG